VNVTVTQLTDQLLASYARVGGINHLDGTNLPSKTAVCSITTDLLRLLFPGFFHEQLIHSSELKVETASLMDSVLGRLEDEIYKSLEYRPPEGMSKKELRPAARALTLEFLSNLPRIRELLQTDAEAAYKGDEVAIDIYKTCAEFLGRGLAVLIDVINPELIILGSIYGRAKSLIEPYMRKALEQEAISDSYKNCLIVSPGLSENIGDMAALALARESIIA